MKTLFVAVNAKYVHTNIAVRYLTLFCRQKSIECDFAEFTVNEPQNNILEKLPLTNSEGAYYDLKKHSHYFVCKKCKKSIPMSFCPVAAIEKAMPKDMDFTITEHNIEIIGYCKACNK